MFLFFFFTFSFSGYLSGNPLSSRRFRNSVYFSVFFLFFYDTPPLFSPSRAATNYLCCVFYFDVKKKEEGSLGKYDKLVLYGFHSTRLINPDIYIVNPPFFYPS